MLKKIIHKLLKNKKIFILFFLTSLNLVYGQTPKYSFDIIKNPTDDLYWFQNYNNKGLNQSELNLITRFEITKKNTNYQISLISTSSEEKKFIIGESYIQHNFKDNSYLKIGRYYRNHSEYLNDELSSGHMQISHNAQPLPKVGFVKLLSFYKVDLKFGISHGQFSKDDYYHKAPLLHEKFVYLDIPIKDDSQFSIGIAHNAMWGGATPSRDYPVNIKNFLKVFVAADGFDPGSSENGQPLHQNALGNHVGIWDFSYQKSNNEKNLTLYYQHIFETDTGIRFSNKFDGLWGAELKNYLPKTTILLEYLSTENQLSPDNDQMERYYYNYQYVLGWSYKKNNLGNPYIPIYRNYNDIKIINAMHFAIKGDILNNYYTIQMGRRVNFSDSINYKLLLERKIKNNFSLGCFVVGNEDANSFGFIFSKNMEQ
tara:strand:- start:477 stop:1757 length:1281 start_codon:yes stop_codon:yes gene_type:complete